MSTRLPGAKYKRVFESGRVLKGRLMSAWVLRHPDAGRKAGRIMREAFRLLADELPPDADWVLVGRSSLKGRQTADVAAELRWMCGRC